MVAMAARKRIPSDLPPAGKGHHRLPARLVPAITGGSHADTPPPKDGRLPFFRASEAAAAASGIHRTVWTGLESGRRSPTWETLARLAPVLGASLGDFDLSEKKE